MATGGRQVGAHLRAEKPTQFEQAILFMSDAHHRLWADLKQPLRRFLRELTCRLVPALEQEPGALAPRYFWRPPRKPFSEYEPQHYLHILLWKQPANDSAAPETVLPEESQNDSLRSMAYYVKNLRNKYDHENTVTAEEQLADCLVMLRFVGRSKQLLTDESAATDVEDVLLTHVPLLLSIFIENRSLRLPIEENSPSSAVLPLVPATIAAGESSKASIAAVERKIDALVSFAIEASRYADELRKDNVRIQAQLTSIDARQVTLSDQIAQLPPKDESPEQDLDELTYASAVEELFSDDPEPEGPAPLPALTLEEARDLLISLRWRIWEDLGTGPSADGILRKRMMQHILNNRITTEAALRSTVPAHELEATASSHFRYLDEIFAIVRRLR